MDNLKGLGGFTPIALLIYGTFIIIVAYTGILTYKVNVQTISVSPTILPTTPSPKPTSTPEPKAVKTTDLDPITNCGPGQYSKQYIRDKSSNCKNYVDCGLQNNTVYTLMLKAECDKRQAANSRTTTTYQTTTYTPCRLCYHYTSGDKCVNYDHLVKTNVECEEQQAKINSYGNSYVPTANTSTTQTPDAAYNNLLEQHAEACKAVVAEWTGIKESWDESAYSSSYESVQALDKRRQEYQAEMYSVGCTQTISIY